MKRGIFMEKKKRSVKMIILFIVVVLAVILLIHIFRNYSILKKIEEKQAEILKSENYSYTIENKINEKTSVERYYKNGKSIEVLKSEDTTVITWRDKLTGETIRLYPNVLRANVSEGGMIFDMTIPYMVTKDTAIALSLVSFITSEEFDGKDCYVIKSKGEKLYINKEDGTILKAISKDVDVEYTKWTFNKLTEDDVARPNVIGYEIVD